MEIARKIVGLLALTFLFASIGVLFNAGTVAQIFLTSLGLAAFVFLLFKERRVVFKNIKKTLHFVNFIFWKICSISKYFSNLFLEVVSITIEAVADNAKNILFVLLFLIFPIITVVKLLDVFQFDSGFFTDVYWFHFALFSSLTGFNLLKIWFGVVPATTVRRVSILVTSTLALTILASGIAVYLFGDSFIELIESENQAILVFIFAFMPLSVIGLITIFSVLGAIIAFAWILYLYFTAIPIYIFDTIFDFEHSAAVLKFKKRRASAASSRALSFILGLKPKPIPPDDSKGARMATGEEVVSVYAPNDPAAMAFGHLGRPLYLKTEKHVLIMASTRSGKGTTLLIPHLLAYRGSAFVLDPKGENAKATGRHRATLNDRIHYLDPFGITGKARSRFNPMSRMTAFNMEAESKALAAALFVSNIDKRDHWTAAGQQLVAAFILYVFLSPDIPDDQRDLVTVRRLLLGQVKRSLEDMKTIDDDEGLLKYLATSFLETPEKELGSIVSTAQRETEILDNPYIAECVSASGEGEEVDFSAWHKETMTVYLCLSAPKFPIFNRWLRLVLTSALDEMTDSLNPPPLPVCFLLDELATLGHLAPVENAVGLAAGYGVQLVTVFQDVAQMRDLYKGRWASFVSNAGIRAVFSVDDYESAKYWSDFMGGVLVETKSSNVDVYGYSKGENLGETIRPLYSPERIMYEFAAGKMLVLAQGVHPIESARVVYFRDDRLKGLWDDPRIPVAPRPAPRASGARATPKAPRPSRRAKPEPPPKTPTLAGGGAGRQASAGSGVRSRRAPPRS